MREYRRTYYCWKTIILLLNIKILQNTHKKILENSHRTKKIEYLYFALFLCRTLTYMTTITVSVDLSRYPLLCNTHGELKANIDDIIRNLIDIGYDTKFGLTTLATPNSAEPLTIESSIYNHISSLHKRTEKTEDIMNELTTTLHKLIGISSNSAKKGGFAEGIL